MRRLVATLAAFGTVVCAQSAVNADLLTNGNLDKCTATEIVPGFFLPKPRNWVNEAFRTISGPYEDEMSSEPWAGPAPTPVTTDGDAAFPDGVGIGNDGAVFFKPFSGGGANGLATGHLYQDVPASPGLQYRMTGWAGAEPNAMMQGAEFALEFRNGGGGLIGAAVLDLIAAGLFVDNGQAFDYKEFSVNAIAPAGTASVRVRASMIGAQNNPAGGGQAYVVDDFTLNVVPEPGTALLGLIALPAMLRRSRRH